MKLHAPKLCLFFLSKMTIRVLYDRDRNRTYLKQKNVFCFRHPKKKKKKSNKQNKTERKKTKPVLFPSQLYTGWLQSILRKIFLGWKAYSGGLLSSVRQSPPSPFPSMIWSGVQSIALLHHAKKRGFFLPFFFFFFFFWLKKKKGLNIL